MIDEEKFRQLKRKAEEAQTAKDRATGQLQSVQKRLKDEFGCSSLKEAEAKAEKLDEEAKAAEEEFESAVQDFEEKWDARNNSKD